MRDIFRWDRINILFVPVGGVYTIDPSQALVVIQQINPNIAIPMHYRTPKHNERIFGKLATLDEFLKIAGECYQIQIFNSNEIHISTENLPSKTTIYVPKYIK